MRKVFRTRRFACASGKNGMEKRTAVTQVLDQQSRLGAGAGEGSRQGRADTISREMWECQETQ